MFGRKSAWKFSPCPSPCMCSLSQQINKSKKRKLLGSVVYILLLQFFPTNWMDFIQVSIPVKAPELFLPRSSLTSTLPSPVVLFFVVIYFDCQHLMQLLFLTSWITFFTWLLGHSICLVSYFSGSFLSSFSGPIFNIDIPSDISVCIRVWYLVGSVAPVPSSTNLTGMFYDYIMVK